MWRFFASGKFELNLKCLLSDSPFAQPRAAALWQCLFPQKSNFYMGTQHTMTRECRGPTEGLQWPKRKWCASGQRYSPAQRSVSCHQLQTYGGFAAIQDHSALLYLSQGGKKKKKRTTLKSLKGWYVTGWVSVLSYLLPHLTAWQAPAEGGTGASSALSCWSADQFVFLNMTIGAAKPDNEKLKVK